MRVIGGTGSGKGPKSSRVRRWRQLLANRGGWTTFKTVTSLAVGHILKAPGGFSATAKPLPAELWRNSGLLPAQAHPFDVLHGTETSGLTWGEDMPTGHPHDAWNTAYYGIAPSIFEQAVAVLRDQQHLDLSAFTFIDLGAGKGRAVMLAALQPFARVLGVELVPRLHSVAQQNLARFRGRSAEILLADAAEFPWAAQLGDRPLAGPLLLFLYNPFSRPVLRALLRRLQRELARTVDISEAWLLYVNPELDGELARHRWVTRVCLQTVEISEEDRLADRFGSTSETFGVYRCDARR